MGFVRKYGKLLTCLLGMIATGTVFAMSMVTFGWFSNNKQVTATGATVEVEAPVCVFVSSTFTPDVGQTAVPFDALADNGFGYKAGFSPANVLYPASTSDGKTFYFSNSVNPDGSALTLTGETPTFGTVPEGSTARLFYLQQSFYFCSLNGDDVDLALTGVTFAPGESFAGASLYKSVRVALSADGGNTFKLVRCKDGGDTTKPVCDSGSVVSTDPAVSSDAITDTTFPFRILGNRTVDDVRVCPCTEVIVRIWIEGQNPNAIVTYAGTAFTVDFAFDVVEKTES